MKHCPTCNLPLQRVAYEGVPIFRCETCGGCLVTEFRLDGIMRRRVTSTAELKAEAKDGFQQHPETKRSCPSCRGSMRKELLSGTIRLYTDTCNRCGNVWLDAGELAVIQLMYEHSPSGINAEAVKARMAELQASPERLRRFEEDLRKLPRGTDLVGAIGQGFTEPIVNALEAICRL